MTTITGTSGGDPNLRGTASADTIFGRGGNDTLIGLGGGDILDGGGGADEIFGSGGFDHASYKSSTAAVAIDLARFSFSGGQAEGDHLYGIEGVVGTAFQDNLDGDDQRNVLSGGGDGDVLYGAGGDDTLIGGDGSDQLEGGAGDDVLRGDAGIDYVTYARHDVTSVTVDLAAGTASGGATGQDRLSGIEFVRGSLEADRIAGNSGANLLEGIFGADVLIGRGGADQFLYQSIYDSTAAAPDRILDFSRAQGDRINLDPLDANADVPDDQAFAFIGQGAFTGAGQLRSYQQGGDTIVEANTSEAGAGAELRIVLDPLVNLQGTDFLL